MRARDAGATGRVPVAGVRAAGPLKEGYPHPWRRYVALGDSFTEGLWDPDPRRPGGLRGWADRVAEALAVGEDFAYANLAVRGLLLEQILDRQVTPALALRPDLITLSAGGNDMVFRGGDPDRLAAGLEAGVGLLCGAGATVILFTGPDWGSTPVLGRNRGQVAILNENIHAIASRHRALTVDLWSLRRLKEPRMWGPDRLHLSPLGHHLVALEVLRTLNVPHAMPPLEPGEVELGNRRRNRAEDLQWAGTYLVPWVLRRLRPKAPVPERRAKRPEADPVTLEGHSSGRSSLPLRG